MSEHEDDPTRQFFDQSSIVADYAHLDGLTPAEEKALGPLLGSSVRLLDVGIGAGRTTEALISRVGAYVGIDYAPGMIDATSSRFPGVQLRCADARDLSEEADGAFDLVLFSFNGLDCLDLSGRRSALAEFRRVLRNEGMLVFSSHDPRSVVRMASSSAGPRWRRVAVGAMATARAAARLVPSAAFWRGSGFVRDLADPIQIFHAAPSYVGREVGLAGFAVERVIASHARRGRVVRPPWWYYVCRAI